MREPTLDEIKWWKSLMRLIAKQPDGIGAFFDGISIIAVDGEALRNGPVYSDDRLYHLPKISTTSVGAGML